MSNLVKRTTQVTVITVASLWLAGTQAVMPPSTGSPKALPTLTGATLKVPDWVMRPKALPGYNDKVDGRLWQLVDEARTKKAMDVQAKAWSLAVPYEQGTVAVTLLAERGASLDSLKAGVVQSGGQVTATLDGAVYARVPLDKVQALGEQRSLYYLAAQEMYYPMAMESTAKQRLGEGVQRVQAERLHQAGITGKGIKVGILDFGFGRYSELQRAGLVPPPKAQRPFNQAQVLENNNVHGTGCAEIIHAMAPDAELTIAAVDGATDQIIQAALWLAEQGVDIISFSGGGTIGPKDGRALLDRLVEKVVAERKILWVNAAGNEGQAHWGGKIQDQDRNQLVDIAPGRPDGIVMQAGGQQLQIAVGWEDWGADPDQPSASQDIDAALGVWNPASNQIEWLTASQNPQNGRGVPVEVIQVPAQPEQVYILVLPVRQVNKPVKVDVFVKGAAKLEPLVPESSVAIPATARSALAVGAVDVSNDQLEPYSSWGPTGDGRVKPEVSAPDNTLSAAYSDGGGRFPGTSAACPHVSGYAALLKQMQPTTSVSDLRAAVVRYVQPKGSPIPNNQYGYGRIAADTVQIGQSERPAQPGQPQLLKPILDVLEKRGGNKEGGEAPAGTPPPRKLEDLLR